VTSPNTIIQTRWASFYLSREFFGGDLASSNDFQTQCRKFSRDKLIRACSVLNCVLKDLNSVLPNLNVHEALLRILFSPQIADELVQNSRSDTHARVFFHRRQLLNVIKEGIRSQTTEGLDPYESKNNEEFARLLLMANDLLYRDDQESRLPDKILLNMVQINEYSPSSLPNKIARTYYMLNKFFNEAPKGPTFVDIPQIFEKATSIPISTYNHLNVGIFSKYLTYTFEDYQKKKDSFFLNPDWFRNAPVKPDIISRFFEEVSGNALRLQGELQSRDFGIDDLTALRKYPVFREEHQYLVDLFFIGDKLETGAFWSAHQSLGGKDRLKLHAFWGMLFESYVLWMLDHYSEPTLNQVSKNPKTKNGNIEISDTAIRCGESLVLIETKGSTFTAEAKYGSSPKKLLEEIHTKLVGGDDEKKGVTQLASSLKYVAFSNLSDISTIRRVYPVIITRDDIGGSFYINSLLNDEFQKVIPLDLNFEVASLLCMSADIFESIVPFLKHVPMADILKARIDSEPALKTSFRAISNTALANAPASPNELIKEGSRAFLEETVKELFPGESL
jgi:hypothetical protein